MKDKSLRRFENNTKLNTEEDFSDEIKRHEDTIVEYIKTKVEAIKENDMQTKNIYMRRVLYSAFLIGLSLGQLHRWASYKFDTINRWKNEKTIKQICTELEKRLGV